MSPESIVKFVASQMAGVSRRGFSLLHERQAIDAIGTLEQRLGLPITSNHAAIESVRQLGDANDVRGFSVGTIRAICT